MKRLFILSAAVAALASCSNSEVITEVNEPQVPDKAIAFETFSSNATRGGAENSGQTSTNKLEEHHETFKVWGYKDVQTDYVFNGVTVFYTSPTAEVQSGSWNYSPIHFWDKNANSYEFYACAPATASEATSSFTLKQQTTSPATQANDYFTLSEVTLKNVTSSKTDYVHSLKDNQVTNNVNESGVTSSSPISYGNANTDYMIANACNVESDQFGSAVQLHFNHILSRLNITVKKGNNLGGNIKVKLNSLTVNNLVANGNFDESAAPENLASGTNNRWTRENPSYVSYVANPLAKVNDAAQGDNSNLVESAEKYVLQSLVMPQEVTYESVKRDGSDNESKPYLKLVYTIVNDTYEETFKAYFNLAAAFGANATNNTIAFNEGWQNTLHITIDATQITFKPDVYQWKDNENKDFDAESGTSSNHPTNP